MDIKTIKEEILFINDAINEEIEMVLKHKDRIPRIELDMVMSNLQELYEYFYKLQKLNEKLLTKPIVPKEIPKKPENSGVKEKVEIKHIEKTLPVEKTLKTETKTIENIQQVEETSAEIKTNIKTEKPKTEAVETFQPPEEKPVETKTYIKPEKPKTPEQKKSTLDLFAENTNTIGDKFLEKKDKSIAASMSHNHITNIKKAIGINEKFLFINELFNGNMQEYNQVLDKFNLFNNVYEAEQFINELKSKYNWEAENDAFIKFMEFIKRKFSL